MNEMKYLFLFANELTRFQQIYMLAKKQKYKTFFLHLKAFVSRQFHAKIQHFQSDRGIELKSLGTYVFQGSYNCKISCPYTPS